MPDNAIPADEDGSIYAEADAKICRASLVKEFGCDAVLAAFRDVNRMRPQAIEKVLDEERAEPPCRSRVRPVRCHNRGAR